MSNSVHHSELFTQDLQNWKRKAMNELSRTTELWQHRQHQQHQQHHCQKFDKWPFGDLFWQHCEFDKYRFINNDEILSRSYEKPDYAKRTDIKMYLYNITMNHDSVIKRFTEMNATTVAWRTNWRAFSLKWRIMKKLDFANLDLSERWWY